MLRALKKKYRNYQVKKKFDAANVVRDDDYEKAQVAYSNEHPDVEALGVVKLGVRVITPHEEGTFITFPKKYDALVQRMHRDMCAKLEDSNLRSFSSGNKDLDKQLNDTKGPLASISEYQEKKIRNVKLYNAEDLDGLQEFLDHVVPQIEEKIYGSKIMIEDITALRNPKCVIEEKSSTLWHHDNHHRAVSKIMLYLNDVGPDNGPFQYLRNKETKEAIFVEPSLPPKYTDGRVPLEEIERLRNEGYEDHLATGKAGTFLLFSLNVIHKGNYPKEGLRDAVMIRFAPKAV